MGQSLIPIVAADPSVPALPENLMTLFLLPGVLQELSIAVQGPEMLSAGKQDVPVSAATAVGSPQVPLVLCCIALCAH